MNLSTATLEMPRPADDGAEVREMLRTSLMTLLDRIYSFEQRAAGRASPGREVPGAWKAYGELGLLALSLPEELGGFAAGLTDIAMVAETLGGLMALEPYVPTMTAARLIAAAGTPAQQAAWLPGIAAGTVRVALAHEDDGERLGRPAATTATPEGTGWRLSGRKAVIAGGDTADLFILSARIGDETALFLLPADKGTRRSYRCFDWTGAADIDVNDVVLPTETRMAGGAEALAQALDEATALACADAIGAVRAANRLVREHTATRRQFGRPLDNFQVLQHRLVNMAIAEELAAPITAAALAACEASAPTDRARAVSAAKVNVGDAARLVGQECVQLHGGMGLTQEYPASHLFARLGLFERSNGDRDVHIERYATLMT